MTPQSSFMVMAAIRPEREAELRRLLDSMNGAPGHARPDNPVIPFQSFDGLHVARFLIVDDKSTGDVTAHGITPRTYPLYLAFLGDVDGTADAFLRDVATRAPKGLRALFSCCEGLTPDTDILAWMLARQVPNAAGYVNWRGRTVRRVREEAALYDAIQRHIEHERATLEGRPAREVHAALRHLVEADVAAKRLSLSREQSTPLRWRIANLVHLIGVPLVALLTLPLLLPVVLVGLVMLRRLERSDPELIGRPTPEYAAALAHIEDHQVTNQFSAMGSLKPGLVRLGTTWLVLVAIDYAARHLYTRGSLGRVRSIHFARWVFIDNRQRIVFLSNYDGSLESYMDDFINKVGFGLNLVFSNGIGYPRSKWLIKDGCHDERKFKQYLRRHQMPTQVWYKAYPTLTAADLERHVRVREGIAAADLDEQAATSWVALL